MLDHLEHAAVLRNHPAILQRVFGRKAQHDNRGRIGGVEPLDHRGHCLCAHEGHVAIENQHVAFETGQRLARLQHGVAGAQLRLLHGNRRAVTQRLFELLAPVPGHHDLPRRRQTGGAGHQVGEHRSPGDGVKHLVQVAFHASALAGGKNDKSEGRGGSGRGGFVCRGHGAHHCQLILAVSRTARH